MAFIIIFKSHKESLNKILKNNQISNFRRLLSKVSKMGKHKEALINNRLILRP